MSYREIIILIPSHSLEDFPTELGDDEASSLLNAFAIAWHPEFLADSETVPTWHRADDPPETFDDRLIIIPSACEDWMPSGWEERAAAEGATVVSGLTERSEMLAAALGRDIPATDTKPAEDADHEPDTDNTDDTQEEIEQDESATEPVDEDLVADFFSLGTCYLQMELLSRHMHHFTSMDEIHLQREAVAAAKAAVVNDRETAEAHLRACFETLAETRERFYPVDCYLIDLCLVAPDFVNESLDRMLDDTRPTNILLNGRDLEEIAEAHPETIQKMGEAWTQGTLDILGGDYDEVAAPLAPFESSLYDLKRGQALFRENFDRTPTTWARRRFGLNPQLPQLLQKSGYHSAMHFLLDDGIYPDTEDSKIRWEGCDGTVIDAISRLPLAADSVASYLRFPMRMAETMEQDHTAALMLARWPEVKSPWFEDFARMHKYAPVLGRFITLNDFFEQTDTPGPLSSYRAHEYLTPFVLQNVARRLDNPISSFTEHIVRRRRFDVACWQLRVANILMGRDVDEGLAGDAEDIIERASYDCLDEDIDLAANSAAAEQTIADIEATAFQNLSKVILHGADPKPGYLVINPLSFTRRVVVDVPNVTSAIDDVDCVKAQQIDDQNKQLLVEVPGSGFAWIPCQSTDASAKKRKPPKTPLAEDFIVRNEFFEAEISNVTGGLARLRNQGRRANRLSQQIAFRFPRERTFTMGEGESAEQIKSYYSAMCITSVKVLCSGPSKGELLTTGVVMDQQQNSVIAEFQQTFRAWRGKPELEIDIELDVKKTPEGDPWSNYFAARFAWNDGAASVTRSLYTCAQPAEGERFENPHYLEIVEGDMRTTILNQGNCFFRRTGMRMVDNVLVAEGEQRRSFRYVISLDSSYPMQEALHALTPPTVISTETGPPRMGQTGWLFHLDTKAIQIMQVLPVQTPRPANIEPWQEHDYPDVPTGKGFTLRLAETEGRHRTARLLCFRTPTSARQRDFTGKTISDLSIEDDAVRIDFTAYEIVDVELRFE
ncbi:MAG: hypothetical protein CMJ78_12250 [Planctomycetaceae bacterium]|nr:hypothetical protein [Planctomycetaceae bacterium]